METLKNGDIDGCLNGACPPTVGVRETLLCDSASDVYQARLALIGTSVGAYWRNLMLGMIVKPIHIDGPELMQLGIRGWASGIDSLTSRADSGGSRRRCDDKSRSAPAGHLLPLGFTALRKGVVRVSRQDDAVLGRTGTNKLGVS